jgi:hypothetical protein
VRELRKRATQVSRELDLMVVIPFKSSPHHSQSGMKRSWPDCERCVTDARLAFRCTMAAQRGWNIKETAEKLLEVSAKAQERARLHDKGCARHLQECR